MRRLLYIAVSNSCVDLLPVPSKWELTEAHKLQRQNRPSKALTNHRATYDPPITTYSRCAIILIKSKRADQNQHCYYPIMAPQTTKTSPWTMKVLRPILRRREEEDHQELEIRSLSEEEIKSLRKTDPFMYYSIPGVHRAATLLELVDDVDHSNKDALCRRGGQGHDRRKQLPVKRQKASVSRRTAISFEAHPSLIFG